MFSTDGNSSISGSVNSATNNEAEYEALVKGMAIVQRIGGKSIRLFSDLRLVVDQVRGEFEAKDERM